MSGPLLLIAAGGTGGHMFPAQALAEAMIARGWRVKLSTDARGARYAGGFPAEVVIEEMASATFARGGLAAKALVRSTTRWASHHSQGVRTSGGLTAALPMLVAALTSAWQRKPHSTHLKVAWSGRLALATCPQHEHRCDV